MLLAWESIKSIVAAPHKPLARLHSPGVCLNWNKNSNWHGHHCSRLHCVSFPHNCISAPEISWKHEEKLSSGWVGEATNKSNLRVWLINILLLPLLCARIWISYILLWPWKGELRSCRTMEMGKTAAAASRENKSGLKDKTNTITERAAHRRLINERGSRKRSLQIDSNAGNINLNILWRKLCSNLLFIVRHFQFQR